MKEGKSTLEKVFDDLLPAVLFAMAVALNIKCIVVNTNVYKYIQKYGYYAVYLNYHRYQTFLFVTTTVFTALAILIIKEWCS